MSEVTVEGAVHSWVGGMNQFPKDMILTLMGAKEGDW